MAGYDPDEQNSTTVNMKLILGILSLLLSVQKVSSVAMPNADSRDGMLLGQHMRIFEDKAGIVTWDDVLAGKHDTDFKTQAKPVPNFGSTRSIIWGVVEITPPPTSPQTRSSECLMELSHPVLDYVDVVLQDVATKKILNRWETGDLRSFSSRPINHRNFLFPIRTYEQQKLLVFLRLQSESTIQIPFKIWSPTNFYLSDSREIAFLGFLYGLILVMILYNIIVASSLKSLSGYLYALYMSALALTQLCLDGAFYQLFPNLGYINNLGVTFWGNFAYIIVPFFLRQYLRISEWKSVRAAILMAITGYAALGTFVALFVGYYVAVRIQFILGLVGPVLIANIIIQRWRTGFRPAGFLLLGYLFLVLASILLVLTRLDYLPADSFIFKHVVHIGASLEAILLSFGLADRIRLIQKEKELAQAATIEQQQILNAAFARFVPAPFLQILGKKSIPEVLLGDHTEREMTILFADIRGFTTISEKLSPKQTFEFINNYLQGSGPVIRNSGGFIDKYMGDGIMALFEKPDDAISAALRLQDRNARLNRALKGKLVAPLNVGIGIHTGHLMLGTIGEHQRMDGTVISDAVNLASRVESLTKQYGVDLLVTKETLAGMLLGTTDRPYLRRFIDRIAVKGKREPTTIYEVIALKRGQKAKYELGWLEKWVFAIKLYYRAEFVSANTVFTELLETCPTDKTALKFKERCDILIKNPPDSDWNGVAIATSK